MIVNVEIMFRFAVFVVTIEGVEVGVEVLVAVELVIVPQDENFCPPRKTPTVCASVRCSVWSMEPASEAFVPQN